MTVRANVTSIDAVEAFRANLVRYMERARATLDEVDAEVVRTRLWLETDQRNHLAKQVRLRARQLEETRQARFSARLSAFRGEQSARMAVLRAERLLRDAEEKVRVLKKWYLQYDNRVEPLKKQIDRLRNVLDYDLPKAIAYLANMVKVLDEYTTTPPPATDGPVIETEGSTALSDETVDGQPGAQP
ncbi:MAG: hypothetical protein QGI24_03520 [Kiritimatiellia bacterium]|jgi:hypothetical protein|nr:hypothetical protein [Kiritimatiellia bacterium]MDP6847833.1 hypothetical protein [Kiritimatiellia bacterium]